ncbi:MAG: hypothetical protein OHK006_13470 [Thermodesulfovibrionales bacterium]
MTEKKDRKQGASGKPEARQSEKQIPGDKKTRHHPHTHEDRDETPAAESLSARDIAAQKCEATWEQLRTLSENLPDGMIYQVHAGMDGRTRQFTYVSSAVERFHELSADALLEDASLLYSQIVPEDRVVLAEKETSAFAGRTKLEAEVRVRMPSGKTAWRRFTSSPRQGADGVWVWDGIEIDITERKLAEEKLRESESLLRQSQSIARIGHYSLDVLSGTWTSSEVLDEIFGIGPDYPRTVEGWSRIVHPEQRADMLDYFTNRVLGDRSAFDREYRITRVSDGADRWVHGLGRLDLGADGRPTRMLGTIQDVTERKKAEIQIAEHASMIRQIMDTASVGIALVDKNGRFTHANKRMAEMFGCPMDEIIGSDYIDHVHPSEREAAHRHMRELLSSRIPAVEIERHYVRKDGAGFWGYLSCRRFYDVHGNDLGFIGVISDITERRRFEQALKESEEKYRDLFDSSTDGIFILDMDGNFLDANRTAYERLGYTREELLALNIKTLDDPKFAPDVPERLRQIREKGMAVFESGHRRKDGTTMPVEVNSRLYDYKGRPVYFSVIRDITSRKAAEERIRQSEEFIRSILDTVDEGFIVVDRDYRIMTANKAYCGQAGRVCEDIIGRKCYEVSHNSSRPCYDEGEECAVKKAFATGRPHAVLHRHLDAGGHGIFVETKAYPITDGSGSVVSVIETINNITERHLLEEERLKTQKLESIGTLAGGIAHDFNNLLQGIFGYISMAKMTITDRERASAMLEQAEEALHLAVNLTTQLLTFSKGGKPVKKLLRLRPVIENAVKFALSGSHTDYVLASPADLWTVEADGGQVAQVIQNIVLNANEAMAGRGTVEISLNNKEFAEGAYLGLPAGGRFVEIAIRDTGIGIPAQALGRIFDPYFTTKQRGSGLGLATSYSIVRNHGGVIEVKSEVNAGTVFTIYLPAADDAVDDPGRTAPAASETRKGRVLVMDDEEMVRNVAGEMIRALGHEAETAADGREALELFVQARDKGTPFDIVVLDLTVKGGMGGEETMRRLREIDPGVVAVVSSGYADSPVMANYRDYGFSAVLDKPYQVANLKKCLAELLRQG